MSRVRLGDVATEWCGLVLSRKQSRTPTSAKYRLLNLRAINADGCVEMALVDINEVKRNIAGIEKELAKVQSPMAKYMKELGL